MLEINAQFFLGAATELKRLNTVLSTLPEPEGLDDIDRQTREILASGNQDMIDAINAIGARAAGISATRLQTKLLDFETKLTVTQLRTSLYDIESRFADELSFIKLFVIDQARGHLFSGADVLLGKETAERYPSIWFDCEEAAKSLCLGRPTACVFHCMRMLEIAIKAICKRLRIEDPTKVAQRNWHFMLSEIKSKMDSLYPSQSRKHGTEGSLIEKLYVSLDAIKNPWRNETMHVEGVYTEAEAQHILTCVALLIQAMAQGFDENGGDTGPISLIGESK